MAQAVSKRSRHDDDFGRNAADAHHAQLGAGSTGSIAEAAETRAGLQPEVPCAKQMKGVTNAVPARLGDALRTQEGLHIEEQDTPIRPSDFIDVDGLRFVLPYHFDFKLNAKKRMVGRHPVDVFSAEFPIQSREYYEQAYAEGRLRVDGPLDKATGGLRDGQRVRHFVHRHEPPVPAAAPVRVLAVDADHGAVAVHKPAGMPVHVAGQYRKNTVLGHLEAEQPDLGLLHPAHRLDKNVSGVLVLSQNAQAAERLRAAITAQRVRKTYIARVQGTPLLAAALCRKAIQATLDVLVALMMNTAFQLM